MTAAVMYCGVCGKTIPEMPIEEWTQVGNHYFHYACYIEEGKRQKREENEGNVVCLSTIGGGRR